MLMENYNIEYTSTCIVMLNDCGNDRFFIINIDDYATGLHNVKMVAINTMWDGLTNNDVEEAIKTVLHNGGYDIEYELELYRESRLYNDLKCNDEE